MRTITQQEKLTIKYSESDLLQKKWIPFQVVSAKIGDMEKEANVGYKSYRSRLYNSIAGNKYNMISIAGIKCIDVTDPMKTTASLELSFVLEKE